MNFLSHALPYLDQPLVALSTGVPDWLSVVDRKIRARRKLAEQHLDSDDLELSQVAMGIIRHIDDDRWFHGTEAFIDTNMMFAVQLRECLPDDAGFRPTFVGHIIIELILDSLLIEQRPHVADTYYGMIDESTAQAIERCVNLITGKPSDRIAATVHRFAREKFLLDYSDDRKLFRRLNQVLNRVKLPAMPTEVLDWIPRARETVIARRERLLTPPDGSSPFQL